MVFADTWSNQRVSLSLAVLYSLERSNLLKKLKWSLHAVWDVKHYQKLFCVKKNLTNICKLKMKPFAGHKTYIDVNLFDTNFFTENAA